MAKLPGSARAVIDRVRGTQSVQAWLEEAAPRLARMQCGFDPITPIGWQDLAEQLGDPNET